MAALFFDMQDAASIGIVSYAAVGCGELLIWLRHVAYLSRT